LSGYDAGMAWGITLDAAMNEASAKWWWWFSALISYSANTAAGIVTNLTSSSSLIQSLIDSGEFTSSLILGNVPLASGGPITAKYNKVNGTFRCRWT
jgi:hypothetical protein